MGSRRVSLSRLQDYEVDGRHNPDVMAAVRLTRVQPVLRAHSRELAGARDGRDPSDAATHPGSIGLETTPTEEAASDFGRQMASDRSNA
jgi:hypothetical protein